MGENEKNGISRRRHVKTVHTNIYIYETAGSAPVFDGADQAPARRPGHQVQGLAPAEQLRRGLCAKGARSAPFCSASGALLLPGALPALALGRQTDLYWRGAQPEGFGAADTFGTTVGMNCATAGTNHIPGCGAAHSPRALCWRPAPLRRVAHRTPARCRAATPGTSATATWRSRARRSCTPAARRRAIGPR